MPNVSWARAGPTPWLVTEWPGTHPAVAGITFGAGWLHQPTEHLGVVSLLAAWLTASLNRPGSLPDAELRVTFTVVQTSSSLMAVGAAGAVGAALRRVDEVLDEGPDAELLESWRDRAMSHRNALTPWRLHLATRWPGHRPHLAALGTLALDTVDSSPLGTFATERFGRAGRVYWTNDPEVAAPAGPPVAGRWAEGIGPSGRRAEPGCVLARNADELCTVAARSTPAMEVGAVLLARALRRRL